MDITALKTQLPAQVYGLLPAAIESFAIDDKLKLAHFLSQCDYESEHFSVLTENLNYSAAALLKTFPSHFNAAEAAAYARQPEKIANSAYANRLGNGDEASGDGWKYRGRGYIQLTGKVNYTAFAGFMKIPGIVATPDLVAGTYALDSAGFFFRENDIFAIAEEGATDDVVKKVTRAVNGGINGLAGRTTLFHRYYDLLQTNLVT